MKFNSQIRELDVFQHLRWTQAEIKNEPMLFNCDFQGAHCLGGDITKEFLSKIPDDWKRSDLIIDSRVHMLMPGWYPCIPGYHHDDVPRSTESGQPNYKNPEYRSEHLMGLVNGDICPTEFALGEIDLEVPTEGIIYKKWHDEVVKSIASGDMKKVSARSGIVTYFDCDAFHQGTRAVASGWRWFIRVSRNTARTKVPTNELRRQVQVYLENPTEGW